MELGNLTEPVYELIPGLAPEDLGGLRGLHAMVQGFLGLVQPNPFPQDLIRSLIQGQEDSSTLIKEVLAYEAGFLVCLLLGLLFVVLVPLVGLCFCCCRLCGNCGGRLHQNQDKGSTGRRQTLAILLLLLSILLLAGNSLIFVSNQQMSESVSSGPGSLNSSLGNMQIFLYSIPQDFDKIIKASSEPVGNVNASLQDIGQQLGGKVLVQVQGEVYPALGNMSELLSEAQEMEKELQVMTNSSEKLQDQWEVLKQNLSAVQTELRDIKQDCGDPCKSLELNDLDINFNISEIPNVDPEIELLSNLLNTNPQAHVQQAYQILNSTPEAVHNQTRDFVAEAQGLLESILKQLDSIGKENQLKEVLENVDEMLGLFGNQIKAVEPYLSQADQYRWAVGVCLGCVVLLVVLCFMLGLLLGSLGLQPHTLPTQRGCLSNSGGNLLMAGAGFSFLFSWLLMLLVMGLFLLGGQGYTLVCQPWHRGELFQVIDSGLLPGLNLSQILGLENSTLTLGGFYNNCQHNEPLWSTLNLDSVIHLDGYLNLSQYKDQIQDSFDKVQIHTNSVTLLAPKQLSALEKLGHSGLQDLDFSDFLSQNQSKADVAKKLQKGAKDLRRLQDPLDKISPEMQSLNRSLLRLQSSIQQIRAQLNGSLDAIQKAQEFLNDSVPAIIKNESGNFLYTQFSYFQKYVEWASHMLRKEMARCGPAAQVLDSVETVVCSVVVGNLNIFWFSLGWCTVLLLPGLILAIRLAKYYRRMDTADVFSGDTYVNRQAFEMSQKPPPFHFPRAETRY
ncbi:prominin-1-A-like isoform X2 [Ornithorhynchus anatinus]|uniref:prominin-1-A-like isoform X2 n=1 Tax=Ornithorhynchus anatinus TaxID=9258 RepID=UPI0010A7DB95|nr:prominin-1-A-like isoform X2 [Ornithorhynchus anatinus]